MATLFSPFLVGVDGNGLAMAGAKLYFYQTGTTTPQDTYTDSGLGTPNTNPVVADANGLFPPIYLASSPLYKAVLTTSAGTTVATRDPLLFNKNITTRGDIIVGGVGGIEQRLAIGAAHRVLKTTDGVDPSWGLVDLTTDVTGLLPGANIGQFLSYQTGAVSTTATALPVDDTIPQNTEGGQFMTLAITPISSTSILEIRVTAFLASSDGSTLAAALFQDSTASALAAGFVTPVTVNAATLVSFTHKMISGTTSATTFKVRCGCVATTTFNGTSGTRYFGGVLASSITIRESGA